MKKWPSLKSIGKQTYSRQISDQPKQNIWWNNLFQAKCWSWAKWLAVSFKDKLWDKFLIQSKITLTDLKRILAKSVLYMTQLNVKIKSVWEKSQKLFRLTSDIGLEPRFNFESTNKFIERKVFHFHLIVFIIHPWPNAKKNGKGMLHKWGEFWPQKLSWDLFLELCEPHQPYLTLIGHHDWTMSEGDCELMIVSIKLFLKFCWEAQ